MKNISFKKKYTIFLSVIMIVVLTIILLLGEITKVPNHYKHKNICFITPDLTCSSSLREITKLYGTPIRVENDFETKFEKTFFYQMEFENKHIEFSASSKIFPINSSVYRYFFSIECLNQTEAKNHFENFHKTMVDFYKTEEQFKIESKSEDEIRYSISSGATGMYYYLNLNNSTISLQIFCNF